MEIDSEEITELNCCAPSEEQGDVVLDVPYHSGPLERYPCFYCKANNVEVRLFHNPKKLEAVYLCRNCKESEQPFACFEPVTFKFRVHRPTPELIAQHQEQLLKQTTN